MSWLAAAQVVDRDGSGAVEHADRGSYAIRACFINPRTTEADVDRLASAARRIGDRLLAR